MQSVGIVWMQVVANLANPDVALTLAYAAWWHIR
jgi:hypothetical protein